ncbi:MAG: restriction endonuclease subunit S [Gammaproteobacteria bacterium]
MKSEWQVLNLEDCLEALIDYRGKTPKKTTSGIPLVTAKVIKGGRIEAPSEYIAAEDYDTWMRRGIPKTGDVVMTTEAPLGEVAQLGKEKIALAQRVITLRGKSDLLDSTYLLYLLQTEEMQEKIKARASGTTVLGIKQSELRKIPISVPPLYLQQNVTSVLSALDLRITLLRETNSTLEAIARALFKSWFVDFDPVRAKMEDRALEGIDAETAMLFPDSLEESDLGLIPKGWSTTAVYDLAEYINGAAYRAFEPNEEKKGLPIIKIAELKSGVTPQTRYSTVNMPEKYRINLGDILFSWSGNPDTSIDTFVWPYSSAWLNQHIFRVVPRVEQDRSFVLMTLKCLKPVFAEIARNKQTTGLGHVTVADLKRLKLVCPSKPILDRWSEIATPLLEQAFTIECKIRALAALRDTLLPRLISGQLQMSKDTVTTELVK